MSGVDYYFVMQDGTKFKVRERRCLCVCRDAGLRNAERVNFLTFLDAHCAHFS